MTAPRGEPGARADRRAEGRRDDPDDDRAGAEGQLAGEDAKLRAMRSVWLAMRDEEPSDGGLAELMAAARGKAAAMTPHPRLWARVMSALRRPPVFAFATVLVLLGGAMVVGQHIERTGAPVAAEAQDEARPTAAIERFEAPAGEPVGGDGVREDDVMQPARPVAAPVVPDVRPDPRAASVDRARSTELVEGETSDAAAAARDDGSRSPTANTAPDDAPRRAAAPARLRPGLDGRAGAVTVAEPAGDPARVERKTAATRPQERSGATPPALYRQCEAAATRGDCVEVRRLVKEISATDRGYRKRIADDARRVKRSGIARCLAE